VERKGKNKVIPEKKKEKRNCGPNLARKGVISYQRIKSPCNLVLQSRGKGGKEVPVLQDEKERERQVIPAKKNAATIVCNKQF